jgi:tetratricopeptide (TPR) repeat protein
VPPEPDHQAHAACRFLDAYAERRRAAQRTWTLAAAALILGAGAAAYANSFRGVFLFDDTFAIVENAAVRHLWPPWRPALSPMYASRPLLGLSMAANYAVGGLDPWGYHAVNLAIHLAAGLALFGLVRRTLRTERLREQFGPAADWLALAVALLWTVHPLHTSAVTYIIQRGESMMGLFYLVTLYALVRAVEAPEPSEGRAPLRVAAKQAAEQAAKHAVEQAAKHAVEQTAKQAVEQAAKQEVEQAAKHAVEQAAKHAVEQTANHAVEQTANHAVGQTAKQAVKQAAKQRVWSVIAVTACALGMASKQVMVTAPLAALLYDRTFLAGTFRQALRRRWGLYLGLAATWLVLAQYVLRSVASALEPQGPGPLYPMPTPWEYLATQAGVVAHYLRLAFWPDRLCLDYGWPAGRNLGDMALPAILLGALLGLTLWAAWRRPAAGFLGAWFFLVLAPTSSVVPMEDAAFEHRMYLPMATVVTAAVVGAYAVAHRNFALHRATGWGLAAVALAAVAVPLGWRTILRNADYGSALRMWELGVRQRPENPRARLSLAVALLGDRQTDRAIAELDRAIALEPRYAEAYANRASAYYMKGRPDRALADYDQAIVLRPAYALAYSNRGVAQKALGRLDQAVRDYTRALELNPDFPDACNNRGNAYRLLGRLDLALADLTRAIDLRPDYDQAYVNRAIVYLEAKDYPRAWADVQACRRLGCAPPPDLLEALKAASGRTEP